MLFALRNNHHLIEGTKPSKTFGKALGLGTWLVGGTMASYWWRKLLKLRWSVRVLAMWVARSEIRYVRRGNNS